MPGHRVALERRFERRKCEFTAAPVSTSPCIRILPDPGCQRGSTAVCGEVRGIYPLAQRCNAAAPGIGTRTTLRIIASLSTFDTALLPNLTFGGTMDLAGGVGKDGSFNPPLALNVGMEVGGVPVTIPIGGTLSKPVPDMKRLVSALTKGLAKGLLDAAAGVAAGGEKIDAKALLKGVLGGGEKPAAATTEGEPAAEQEQEQEQDPKDAQREALRKLGGSLLRNVLKSDE